MPKVYAIMDNAVGVDTFIYLQPHDGAAMSYFYNWVLMQNHRDFTLYSIAEIDYIPNQDEPQTPGANQYNVISAVRALVCVMPTEEEENEREKQLRARKVSA